MRFELYFKLSYQLVINSPFRPPSNPASHINFLFLFGGSSFSSNSNKTEKAAACFLFCKKSEDILFVYLSRFSVHACTELTNQRAKTSATATAIFVA